MSGVALGGVIGGLFFLWIAGIRLIAPTQVGWVMQLDWRVHFLGWHFFRNEPWHWPPGRLEGYYHAPDGTAIGFTDSIPILAFALKPFSSILPDSFQYLGLWLLLCFILQGVFGALIARVWTRRASLQLLSATLFVLMPTLLNRVIHPALCAHWLLLCALWLYVRGEPGTTQSPIAQGALALCAGLVHPYMAAMLLAIVTALAIKERRAHGLVAALAGVMTGWWASGLFTVSSGQNLSSEGLGGYSMNLLAPITPSGWSSLLPEWPVGAPGQPFEGFQYFGAGALMLVVIGAGILLRAARELPWSVIWPVTLTTGICAVLAVGPRVTFGSGVMVELTGPVVDRFAIFRATGRFFWPLAYLVLAAAIALVLTRLRPRVATTVLAMAILVQVIDLRNAYAERRAANRSEAFHVRTVALRDPFWTTALPHYDHLVLYFPQQCGSAPMSFEWPAYLAASYGLTINGGEIARSDSAKNEAYCRTLADDMAAGRVSDDTIYLINRPFLEHLRAAALTPITCAERDEIPVCVTARSLEAWESELPKTR